MADGKRIELYKQRQLIEEQLKKCKEEREHARKIREREKQARKLREEAFDMKLQWTMDRQLRRKTKSSDTSVGDSHSNNDDDSSDDNPAVSRLVLSQRNQESVHPVLPQQPRNVRRSKRPLTIGEETGQKEQPISDGSDFVSGYSDDSDHMSQGDDNGLVAEVQSLRQQLAAVNTERNQLISAQELPTVTLDGRQVANNLPRYRQPFPRSLSTQSTKSEAIQNLFVEIDRLGQESNHLKQQLHCKAVEYDDLLQLLEEKEAKLLDSQVENKELQSDLLRLENENYSLSRGQNCTGNYSNSVWNKKVVSELESKLSVLQQQLDHVIKERDQVNKEKNHVTKERDRLIRETDKMSKDNQLMINERDKISKERDHVISQRDLMARGKDHLTKERNQVIKERDQMNKDRDQAVIEKDQLAEERDQVISEMDHVIKDREQVVSERDCLAKERDQVITERDQVIMERDRVIMERDQVIMERDQVITERDQVIMERDQVITERDQVIMERDQVAVERDHLINDGDKVVREKHQLVKEKDQVIREKDQVIKERDQVISEKNQVIQDRDHMIDEKDQEIDEALREKDEIIKERDVVRQDLNETVVNLRQRLDHVIQENLSIEAKLKVANERNEVITDQMAKAQFKLDSDLKQSRDRLDHVTQQRDHVMQQLNHITTVGLSQLRDDMTTVQHLLLHFKKDMLSGATAMYDEMMSQYQVQVDSLQKYYLSREKKSTDEHQQELCRLNQLVDSKSKELQQARREDLLQMERAELNSFEACMWRRQCRKQGIQLAKMNARRLQAMEQYKHSQSGANEMLANTKQQLEVANEEIVTKEQQLESIKQELKNKEIQLELANKELSDVYQVSTKKSEELLELKKRVFCNEQDKLQLKSELSSLRVSRGSNLKLLEAQVKHLVSERDNLKAQLTTLREQLHSRAVAMTSPCGNNSEALQEKIVQLQGRVEARDEVLEELQREMKEKELANFCVVAKLKSNNFELSGQLEAAKAGIAAKETRLREVEDRLAIVEQQLGTSSPTGDNELVRLRSLVSELTYQVQHCCSCRSNLSQSVVTPQLANIHDDPFASRRPKYTLLPRQPTTSWPRNSLLRSQFSINLPGQSDQSIDLLDNTSSDQYSLGPVVVTDDDHVHSQLERVKHQYRTHRRVQSCDSSLSASLPSATSQQATAIEMPATNDVTNKTRPKSAESSHHQQPMKSPLGSCDLPVTPLVTSEGRGSVTPLVGTPVTSEVTTTQSTTATAAATTVTNSIATTNSSEQRKFKLFKRFIGFKPTGESNKGKRSLGPVITISVPTTTAITSEKEWGVKRSESITSNDTSFTTGSISPSLDGCENFSKIERHESFASGVSRTSSIVSRDFLLTTPKVSSCFKPIAPDEESSSEEDWEKPYLVTASQQDLVAWKRKNQSMIDMAAAASMGLSSDYSKTAGMQFSIRLLPQQRSYSSDTINLDTMEASESEEEHERLRNVNELMRRKGRLHCRYSSTGSLVKIYCASDTSMEDIRSLQQ